MSRIGKKPIPIPEGTEVRIDGQTIFVKGPKGELSGKILSDIKIEVKNGRILVQPFFGKNESQKTKAFWGLSRALIANMVEGVTNGFEKKLEIHGIGYKAEVLEGEIVLHAGFSHLVKLKIPEGIKLSVEKNIIIVSGINKEWVGQFAAIIRKVRPTEPYKGKGIRYENEVVRRKVGKRAATTAK